ncbi:MAG TPA: efflux RND transporter periplasmic adaptor subunit [Xanthomonadaceae bacterium]|nr:efflux RND transporter periplasmic adaptor subunit [Xanthomonadaceae bacterium]
MDRVHSLIALLLAGLALSAAAQSPVQVTARPLSELLVHSPAQAPASVESMNESVLSSELTAVIAAFDVEPQSHVANGEVLVRLDDTDYHLALQQSEALLAASRARVDLVTGRLERARRLVVDGFVSVDDVAALETELAVTRADVRVQEATVAVARRALDKTLVRAPFKGHVGARLAAVGQLTTPGSPLLAITDLGAIELSADIPAAEAGLLAQGERIRFESLGLEYRVELLRLSATIDSGTRTRVARLRFIDPPPPPGSQGRLSWQRPGGLLPGHLLVRRNGKLGLFLLEDGHARFHAVAGAQEGRAAMVDLAPATLVIVEGREALNDGDRVTTR